MSRIPTCLNCATEIKAGPFCEKCGQRNVHVRLEFGDLFRDLKEQILDWHLPWLFTIRELLLRPGKVCREYLDGHRVRYVNPLKFVLYLTSIVIVLLGIFPNRYGTNPATGPDASASLNYGELSPIGAFFESNPIILLTLLAPTVAIVFRWLYSRSKYNNVEISCFMFYVLGNGVLLATLVHLGMEFFAEHVLALPTYAYEYLFTFLPIKILVIILVVLAHTIYAATVFFPEPWYFSWLKVIVATVVYALICVASYGQLTGREFQPDRQIQRISTESKILGAGLSWVEYGRYSAANIQRSFFGRLELGGNASYGFFLLDAGRSRDALYNLLLGREQDPRDNAFARYSTTQLGYAYLQTGQADFARSQISAIETLDMNLLRLDSALQSGNRAAILAEVQATGLVPEYNRRLAQWWMEGNAEAAFAEIRRVTLDLETSELQHAVSARWAVLFNDPLLAWAIIENMHEMSLVWRAVWMPYFSEVRKLDAFKNFLRQDGLENFWRSTDTWADQCRPLGADDFESF